MDALWPYQDEGVNWLAAKRLALLADEMGLGKSAQVVRAADRIVANTILVICPATARFVWKQQFERWSIWGHRIRVITSSQDSPVRGQVNIINYDLLARGFATNSFAHKGIMKRLLDVTWDLVVCDEAHYLKESGSLRTRAVLSSNGLAGKTKRLWLVSGTPMPNHPGELWTILVALGAVTENYKEFIQKFCKLGTGFDKWKPSGAKPGTENELAAILGKIMMRRFKRLVLPQLPDLRIDDYPVPKTDIDLKLFFEDAGFDVDGVRKRIVEEEQFVKSVWQRAIASDGQMDMMGMVEALQAVGPSVALYRRWLGAIKATAMAPVIWEELETRAIDKIVVFGYHRQVIQYLQIALEKFDPVVIAGGTSHADREYAVTRFQEDPDCRVFIGQINAAGEAITLTAAKEIVILEPDWTPKNNAQAIMRVHRIGQTHGVRARMVRMAESLDDYISEVLERKTREISQIVG